MKRVLRSPLLPFLYRYFNFSARFILPSVFGDHKPSRKVLRHYTAPFSKPAQRNGTIAFAKSLVNDQPWFETLWVNRDTVSTKPVLLIWGMKDRFITVDYLEKFKTGFHSVQVQTLADCGHFPQEERPDDVAIFIDAFLNYRYDAVNNNRSSVKDDRPVAIDKNSVA
jgi:haloalkane dehalogenase